MDAATATLFASTFGTLAVGILNYLREGRQHRWAREAREEDRTERLDVAEKVHGQLVAARQEIADGTAAASTAVDVAKHIDEKIVAIGNVRTRDAAAEDRQVR
jgi:hypothetical protein